MFLKQIACNDNNQSIVYHPVGIKIEPMKLTKDIISQIFIAVGHLHRLGIIHRDLSPNHFYQVTYFYTQQKRSNPKFINML